MYFYILIIPFLLFSFYMITKISTERRHDKILFKFTQLRRDAMAILIRDNFSIQKQKYISLSELVSLLDVTIKSYDDIKISFFTIKNFFSYLRYYEKDKEMIEEIKIPNDSETVEIYNSFITAMIEALFTYSSFIRSNLCLSILINLLKTVGYLGIKKADYYIKTLTQLKMEYEKIAV